MCVWKHICTYSQVRHIKEFMYTCQFMWRYEYVQGGGSALSTCATPTLLLWSRLKQCRHLIRKLLELIKSLTSLSWGTNPLPVSGHKRAAFTNLKGTLRLAVCVFLPLVYVLRPWHACSHSAGWKQRRADDNERLFAQSVLSRGRTHRHAQSSSCFHMESPVICWALNEADGTSKVVPQQAWAPVSKCAFLFVWGYFLNTSGTFQSAPNEWPLEIVAQSLAITMISEAHEW